ncbi:TPA_asm: hypothetical protein GahPV1_gp27 [Geoglobus ahangari pleomorphic virus 1]|uniref:Uncharacterized protein n=1 Tax=Geoglobus ahangari pleomorphic virus 1 TaxID=3115752 RepID=A0AAT9JGX6_9VIRU|nr:hypothetical protein [Geoglobus ahangari]
MLPVASADYIDMSKFAKQNTTVQELGKFSNQPDLVYWSNETRKFITGTGSKWDIDRWAYVVDYDLDEGWILIYANRTEPVTVVDVFGGVWKKTTIHKGYNRLNFSGVQEYAGLKVVTVGSPWGFAILKQKRDLFYFEDYPIAILKSELAKFGWQRAAGALGIFLVGFALSYWLKRDRLLISFVDNLIILVACVVLILAILSVDYTTAAVRIQAGNTTIVKQIPALELNREKIRDMYNWAFAVFFVLGFIFARYLAEYEKLYLAIVDYSRPIRLYALPYLSKRGLVRDHDNRLARVSFKDDFKQPVSFELDGKSVKGILAVKVEDEVYNSRAEFNLRYSLIAFFAMLVISVVADFLNVFRIDLAYSLFLAVLTAIIFNVRAIKQHFSLEVTKTKLVECSEIMNEDNYTRMLKSAQIKQIAEDYNKLLRAYVREKITMPRKTISELLSVIREIKGGGDE